MNPSDSLRLDENLARLLAAFDQGLDGAGGGEKTYVLPRQPSPPLPGERTLTPLTGSRPNEGSVVELLPPEDGIQEARPPDPPARDGHTADPSSPPPVVPTITGPHRIGRFELRRQLGKGGCGIVFLAYDPKLQREVALKIPRPEMLLSPEARRRLVREALAAAEFDHPNLVPVYETGEIGPVCYIATAFCPGLTLGEWLDRQVYPVPVRQAARLMATIAEAVQHAHDRGVLHRDLKPNNIILQATRNDPNDQEIPPGSVQLRGEYYVPRVVDFGLAKLIERGAPSETTTRQVLGTPKYMAPEQALARHQDIGPAADVYALGVILYELLTGRAPYEGATDVEVLRQAIEGEPVRPRHIRPDIPRDLEAICLKAMEKTPGRRYRTAIDFADDLRRFLDGKPTMARPLKWVGRAARWLRRNDQAVALVVLAVIAVVLFALGSWSMYQTRQLRSDRDTALRDRAERTRADQQREYAEALRAAAAAWKSGDRKAATDLLDTAARLARVGGEPTDFVYRYLSRVVSTERLYVATPAGAVTALAVSPDGMRLVSGHADGSLVVWHRGSGEPLGGANAHTGPIGRIVPSADGRWLFTLGSGEVRGWSWVPSGTLTPAEGLFHHPVGDDRDCHDCACDDHALYVGKDRGFVIRVDLRTGARSPISLLAEDGPVRVLTRDPSGKGVWAAVAGRIYRLATSDRAGDPAGPVLVGREDGAVSRLLVASLPSDYHAVVANRLRLADRAVQPWPARGTVRWLAPLAGGGLVAGESPGRVLVFQGQWFELTTGDVGEVRAGVTSPDGRTLFTGSDDGIIRSWELPEDLVEFGSVPLSAPAVGVAVHPHQPRAIVAGRNPRVVSLALSTLAATGIAGHTFEVVRYVRPAEDTVLGVEFQQGQVTVCELTGSRVRQRWQWALSDAARPTAADLSPDGLVLAVGDDRGRVYAWRTDDGHAFSIMESGLSAPVRRVSVSADGKSVAAPGPDGIRVWSLAQALPLPTVVGESEGVFRLLAQGDRLAVASRTGTVRIYSTVTGREELTLHGHLGRVTAIAGSPDGRVLVTGSNTGEVKFWDLRTGLEVFGLTRHVGPVTCVEFSSDGRRLVTAGTQLAFW